MDFSDIIVHNVDISHHRLIELTQLADQAKPFYDWVEKMAKIETGSAETFNSILLDSSQCVIRDIMGRCYTADIKNVPMMFDGIGRVYKHNKACFFFFAWLIRDAPQQRLSPLLARMRRGAQLTEADAQLDSLSALIYEYRDVARSFEWIVLREVFIDRLEGSRRSIKGHRLEALVRTALITSFQRHYSIHGHYGNFSSVIIAEKQIRLHNHTVDVSAQLTRKSGEQVSLLIPIKTRETEGGGHAHLFSRDVAAATAAILNYDPGAITIIVIIAANWSIAELELMRGSVRAVYHFNTSPNQFFGFDNQSQVSLNKLISAILES